MSNAYGTERATVFDIEDRPVYVTDANGVTVTNAYDNLDRMLSRTYADGSSERFGYSARGLIAYTNQINGTNFFVYDEARRMNFETNANGELLQFYYDSSGSLTNLIDGKGHSTKWGYDAYGHVTNKLDQLGTQILKYTYDPDNRLTNRWSSEKGNTGYSYDNVGNLTTIAYPNSPRVTFQYDALDRVTNMVDAVGATLYVYTVGGQLYTEDGPFASDTVTNGYSNELRVSLGLQQPTGAWTNGFSYDAAGRLSNVTSPPGSFEYGYTVNGTILPGNLVRSISLPNTASITNEYDPLARLAGTFLLNNAGLDLEYSTYGYNSANQRTAYTNLAGTYVQYRYDSIGQLKVATSSTASENRGYAYDKGWNLNWLTNNGSASQFVVNTLNELTQSTTNYDSNGDLTNNAATSISYSYDDENRLISVYDGVNHTYRSDFVYDGLGRIRKQLDYAWGAVGSPPPPSAFWHVTNVVEYIYDGYRVIQERDSNNVPLVSYTRGLDLSGSLGAAGGIGGLLARSSGYSSGNWTSHAYYHADGGGNITCLLDANENIVASYRYDAYGNTISSSGTFATANVYRFSTKEVHAGSGMYYYGFRFYDPSLQRWINRDPLASWLAMAEETYWITPWESFGAENSYQFGYNSPLNYVDPSGLLGIGILGGASAEAGVIYGAGATLSAGAGVFGGGKRGVNLGAFLSGGSFIGGPGLNKRFPKPCKTIPQPPIVGGAYAGAGWGGFLTNAKQASDLRGPFSQWNFNLGIGPFKLSVSFAYNNGTGILSVTGVPPSPGIGVSGSGYPTTTISTR